MPIQRIIVAAAFLALFASMLAGDQPQKLPDARAEAARDRWIKQRGVARERYEVELIKIDSDYQIELDAAVERATKAGDLDRALALRAAKEDLAAPPMPAPAAAAAAPPQAVSKELAARIALTKRLTGSTWTYPNGPNMRFDADGTVTRLPNERGWCAWTAISDKRVMIQYTSGHMDMLAFDLTADTYTWHGYPKPLDNPSRSIERLVNRPQ